MAYCKGQTTFSLGWKKQTTTTPRWMGITTRSMRGNSKKSSTIFCFKLISWIISSFSCKFPNKARSDLSKNFRLKLLPNLPNKSALVMDKASYHMRIAEESKRPSSSGWTKPRIIDWLIEKGEKQTREELNKKFIASLLVDCKKWVTERVYKVSE